MPQRRLSSGGNPSPLKRQPTSLAEAPSSSNAHLIDSPAWVKCNALGKRMGPEQPPYVMCTVASIDGETCSISLPDGSAVAGVSTSDVSWAHEGENPADHCGLMHLSEATVLHNTVQRAADGKFYTWVGPGQLISVNPCKRIAELFGEKKMGEFRGRMVGTTADTLEPHAYAVAEAAMSELHRRPRVAVLVSGESGAGKTEVNRLVVAYIVWRDGEVAAAGGRKSQYAAAGHARSVAEGVLRSSVMLEALGNASMVANSNSSRFGKFVRLLFDLPAGGADAPRLAGARVSTFLLEKCRLCSHGKGEYNFHVLYQLLAGAPSCEGVYHHSQIGLAALGRWGSVGDYHYLRDDDVRRASVGGKDAAPSAAAKARAKKQAGGEPHQMFEALADAARAMGASEAGLEALWRRLRAVLLLGQITFAHKSVGRGLVVAGGGGPMSTCSSALDEPEDSVAAAAAAADPYGLDDGDGDDGGLSTPTGAGGSTMLRDASRPPVMPELIALLDCADLDQLLLNRTIFSPRSGASSQAGLSPTEAAAARDSLAMRLYAGAFDIVVALLNHRLAPPDERLDGSSPSMGCSTLRREPAQLLEQLINFTNEKLHQNFLNCTIFEEERLHKAERLPWQPPPKAQSSDNVASSR